MNNTRSTNGVVTSFYKSNCVEMRWHLSLNANRSHKCLINEIREGEGGEAWEGLVEVEGQSKQCNYYFKN